MTFVGFSKVRNSIAGYCSTIHCGVPACYKRLNLKRSVGGDSKQFANLMRIKMHFTYSYCGKGLPQALQRPSHPGRHANQRKGKGALLACAADEQRQSDSSIPPRMSKLLQNYNAQELESQREELEQRAQARVDKRRGSRVAQKSGSRYTSSMKELELKKEKYFYKVEDGTLRPRVGVHGGEEPRWWALRVTVGREKQVCTAIERRMLQIKEGLENDEIMQEIKTWDISKRVKAWSPKTGKMGNKLVRYAGGGWVLLYAKLDATISSLIKGNINILYVVGSLMRSHRFCTPK